jgi:hypothetical protein
MRRAPPGTRRSSHYAALQAASTRTILRIFERGDLYRGLVAEQLRCFLLKREHRTAFEIAKGLASRNPDWVDIQVLVAQILGETPGAEDEAARKVASLRHAYKLTADSEARLAAVEAEIAKRQSPS